MPSSRLLIIGNGGAGISAIRAARTYGHTGPIHLVSSSQGPAFNPMLAPYFLGGKIPFDRCFPFSRNFYEKNDVTCHFESPAETLDDGNRKVFLKDGTQISYDRCLIATGASPILPGVPGLKDSNRVFPLRTAEDTKRINDVLPSIREAVVLGASQVGVKMAEILILRGIRVTLIDIADQILPHGAYHECAAMISDHLRGHGVDLRLGCNLEGVEDYKNRICLNFRGMPAIEADLCLASTGVRPNVSFLKGTGVKTEQAVLVDTCLRTSVEKIYAAGDVSQGMNLLTGKKEVIGLWGNACYQGRAAGINMAGGHSSYLGAIPDHVNSFFGMTFVHIGDVDVKGRDVIKLAKRGSSGEADGFMIFDHGVMVGVNLINGLHIAGRIRRAVIMRLNWEEQQGRLANCPTESEISLILSALGA